MLKKLFGVVIVLVLTVCMATTALAAPVTADIFNAAEVTEVTVPAGNYANVTILRGGYDLLVTGEGDFTVKYKNQDYVAVDGKVIVPDITVESFFTPTSLKLTNNSDSEVTYSMIGQFPLGTQSNPATVVIGENTASIEAHSF